jgi:UDP:flavonoid glycosyltransferase YjiC (YdhE family)
MGTTLASLAQGLPLLILPQGADQYDVAKRLLAVGAGRVLTPPEVNAAAIRANVLALLNEPSYRASARALQGEIATMPGPAAGVRLIEELVADEHSH